MTKIDNIGELYNALLSRSWDVEIPVFGGPEPEDTEGIWSWSDTYLIIGQCHDDLVIVTRRNYRDFLNGDAPLESIPWWQVRE